MKNIKKYFMLLGSVLLFVGIGAVPCGIFLIIKPDGSIIGLPLSLLDNAPFVNFLIPGLILLILHGIMGTIGAVLCFKKHKISGYLGFFFGFGLVIWITVQIMMIGGGDFLQYFYFGIGVLELLLGSLILYKQRTTIN